jgi:hypothetical protein
VIGPGEIVRNPSLKSDRDRRLTALQGEVAVADQMVHFAVADPNGKAPQPRASPSETPATERRPGYPLASYCRQTGVALLLTTR